MSPWAARPKIGPSDPAEVSHCGRLLPGHDVGRASRDSYQDNILPSGLPVGSPEEALNCVCGLYLNDPTAWLTPPTN